jgi:nitroimidazol reductase NimA-like FMN-containing flavoprotein (pyridoxamine 5'-phosphate oxidase superfamily)
MAKEDSLNRIRDLIRSKDICVLATASGNAPHCSLMAYVPDKDCTSIYLVTSRKTRKWGNITENPQVSLLIDTREEHAGDRRSEAKALTVTGTFERITDDQRREAAKKRLLERHPHLSPILDDPDAEPFCVRIRSYLLLDGLLDAQFEEIP